MYIAIDIGGTKTEIGFFETKELSSLITSSLFPTDQSFAAQLEKLNSEIKKNITDFKNVQGIGVSFPGIVNKEGEILQASNIPDYKGKPLKQELEERFKCEVFIIQDSSCSAAAEIVYGKIKEYSRVVHLIMGTGLGGTFIQMDEDKTTISPIEPGGMIVEVKDGRAHKFNKAKGLLEAYVGGGNIEDHYKLDLANIESNDKLWNEITDYLTVGINNIACILKPQLVVIGGGIGLKRKTELSRVQEKIKQYHEFVDPVEIRFSDVEGNSSLKGALAINFIENLEIDI